MTLTERLDRPTQVRYMLGMVVDTVGSGMYLPVSLLFFHHTTGLPVTRVGVIISTAAVLGLVGSPLAGLLVDRYGARSVLVGVYGVRAVGFAVYPLVHHQAPMFLAVTLVALGDASFPPAMQAFVAEITGGAGRDRLIAAQRSLRNAGLGIGGLIVGTALGAGSDAAYQAVVLAAGGAFLVAGVLIRTIPVSRTAGRARAHGGFRTVFRNRPFLTLTAVNVPTAFGYTVLSVSLPVYLTQKLGAPDSLAGVLYAVNTVGIAALQVPVTRVLARRRRTRSAALGGAVFSLSFLGFAALGAVPEGGTLLIGVFTATVLFTLGELLHGAAASALAASAAPEPTRGRHLAVYQLSWSVPTALAPAVLTALLELSPTALWLVLAAGVGCSALAMIRLETRLPAHAVHPLPPPGPHPAPQHPTGPAAEGASAS
ncbi:MFS transporter [Streptomyces sp. RS10V-4]|uniref:MFS transporter n=1 Tax=Streptomyces rhizoryzae TaxID=2932493 RepID=UPI002004FFF2|nr:MFS transporter [Streptomyces rhizoryzae]MCK7627377.1 MFS transporter [Streptomyces rhizoryzae]